MAHRKKRLLLLYTSVHTGVTALEMSIRGFLLHTVAVWAMSSQPQKISFNWVCKLETTFHLGWSIELLSTPKGRVFQAFGNVQFFNWVGFWKQVLANDSVVGFRVWLIQEGHWIDK